MNRKSTLNGSTVVCQEGTGNGTVILRTRNSNGQESAVKIINPNIAHWLKRPYVDIFKNELEILQKANILGAPKVEGYHEGTYIARDGQSFPVEYLLMEIIDGADLQQIFQEIGNVKFLETTIKYIASGIIKIISELHRKGYVHRDIKPENIMVDSAGNVRIIDFGFSVFLGENRMQSGCFGTNSHIAPEMHAEDVYDAVAADLFAIGVLIYRILFLCRPWNWACDDDYRYVDFKTRNDKFWAETQAMAKRCISPELKAFFNNILGSDPQKRLPLEKWESNCSWFQINVGDVSPPQELTTCVKTLTKRKEMAGYTDLCQLWKSG